MIPALDFAVLPPEVNSGRMYSGAGPGPLLAAAAAWNGIAAELRSTALAYSSVLSELSEQWQGPTSAAMTAAAAPYVAWLNTAAARAEQTAAQAECAVAAYEAAFAATVAPPVIAANRARLMALIATNFLGQNTPAIAATEAEYAEMWAQDAGAMYGYAASSAVATELTPFDPPEQTTSSGGLAAQSAAVDQAAATAAGASQGAVSQLICGGARRIAEPGRTRSDRDRSWRRSRRPGARHLRAGIGLVDHRAGRTDERAVRQGHGLRTVPQLHYLEHHLRVGFSCRPVSWARRPTSLASVNGGGAAGAAPRRQVRPRARRPARWAASGRWAIRWQEAWAKEVPSGRYRCRQAGARPRRCKARLSSALGGEPMVGSSVISFAGDRKHAPGAMGANMGGRGEGRAIPQYGFRPSFVARPPAAG